MDLPPPCIRDELLNEQLAEVSIAAHPRRTVFEGPLRPAESEVGMDDVAIIGDIGQPALLLGNHGGEGELYWKRLVTGGHMHGAWESFEYARIEPGGSVGTHLHSRTEEVYVVIAGEGVLTVDGEQTVMRAGDAVVTPLNSAHAFKNTGPGPLEFLVIETVPPEISARLPHYSPTMDGHR
jgi:mannose-6-phosphate isomerase-like protein (cupin superfamily)